MDGSDSDIKKKKYLYIALAAGVVWLPHRLVWSGQIISLTKGAVQPPQTGQLEWPNHPQTNHWDGLAIPTLGWVSNPNRCQANPPLKKIIIKKKYYASLDHRPFGLGKIYCPGLNLNPDEKARVQNLLTCTLKQLNVVFCWI